jgi:hypothetical protein
MEKFDGGLRAGRVFASVVAAGFFAAAMGLTFLRGMTASLSLLSLPSLSLLLMSLLSPSSLIMLVVPYFLPLSEEQVGQKKVSQTTHYLTKKTRNSPALHRLALLYLVSRSIVAAKSQKLRQKFSEFRWLNTPVRCPRCS